MKENAILQKSAKFAVRIVNLCKYLQKQQKEFILSRQICKSGTSIGANVAEAQCAQSTADFVSKMKIALKEANETRYWLWLLSETKYISNHQYASMDADVDEILKILTAICKHYPQNNS